jgi:transcription antitermination factor NusG
MERHWAVLRTQPRREPVAARSISARRVESYLPWLPGPRASDSAHPLFPGYLFARVATDSDDLLRIRSAPGVAYVLPRDSTPVLLPDLFIESIQARERALGIDSRTRKFHRGDRVVVVSGPFKWIEGLFDRSLSATGRVRILLNLVHGSVGVQMEAAELKLAG